MDAPRAAVLVVGLNLVAVWIAAAAGSAVQPAPTAVPAGAREAQSVARAHDAILDAQDRLAARDSRPPASLAGTRNPFRFGTRPLAADASRPPARAASPPGPVPGMVSSAVAATPVPDLRLVGMAESRDGEGVHRTAIISAGGDLVFATVGLELGGRYRVRAVGESSVELDDLLGGPPLTLRLKS